MAVGEGGRDNGVKALINTTTALGNKTIDLSHKGLTEIPSEVLDLQQLEVKSRKHLSLQTAVLCSSQLLTFFHLSRMH